MDLDGFTEEEMGGLGECLDSGNPEEQQRRNANPMAQLSLGLSPWRRKAVVFGRWKVYGQEMDGCGISPGEEHETIDDVWRVTQKTERRTRQWWKTPTSGPPTAVLHATLVWEIVHSTSPASVQLLRESGGGSISMPECVPTQEGEMPEHWEDGYVQAGYTFAPVDLPTTYTDDVIMTGESAASAGVGGEVMLAESGWAKRHAFGRRWADGNTCIFGDFFSAGLMTSAAVRRLEYEIELVGWRIACELRWTESLIKAGEDTDTTDKTATLAGGAWTHTISIGYPSYGWRRAISNLRVVPLV